jgi:hypothetical protein
VAGSSFLAFVQFALADADDLVGVLEHAARAKQRPEDLAPFGFVLDGGEHAGEFGGGHIEHPAVQGHDEGFASQSRGGADLASQPLQAWAWKSRTSGLVSSR